MAKKRRVRHSRKKIGIKRPHKKRTSRLLLLGVVLLAIISIIILFNPNATTFATFDTTLTKTNYAPGDSFEGKLKLELQAPKDLLPDTTEIKMSVQNKNGKTMCGTGSSAKDCPAFYLCSSGDTIPRYYCNASKKCTNVTYDHDLPEFTGQFEAWCCESNPENCQGSSVLNVITDGGFENSITGIWIASKTGNCVAGVEPIGFKGSYSGKTDSSFANVATEQYAKLTQTFAEVPVSYFGTYGTQRVPTGDVIGIIDNPFKFSVYYEIPTGTEARKGYYFEIIVKGTTGKKLHYYFNVEKTPTDTTTDKYITIKVSSLTLPQKTWKTFEKNLYGDWVSKFGTASKTDKINSIELYSAGKKVLGYVAPPTGMATSIPAIPIIYGQKVLWDEISLQYQSSLSSKCEERDKKCCATGTGIGNYWGLQLSCDTGKDCWDECGESRVISLKDFMDLTSGEYNWSEDENIRYYSKGATPSTPSQYIGGKGQGYGYCSEPNECKNLFIVNLEDLTETFSVPAYVGNYSLSVNVTRTYDSGTATTIYKLANAKQDFYVTESGGPSQPSCPDDDYTFTEGAWSSWATCTQQGRQTRTRTLYGVYDGSDNCPDTKNKTETETQNCTSCTPQWKWQECIEGENQYKGDINECDPNKLIDLTTERDCCVEQWQCSSWSSCDNGEQTRTCSDVYNCDTEFTKPDTTRTCEKPSLILGLWWLWLLIVLIGVLVVLFATKVIPLPGFLKGTKKPRASISGFGATGGESSELTGYIEQALNYGLSKSEIEQKLKDAGWPQDSIDKAFRTASK